MSGLALGKEQKCEAVMRPRELSVVVKGEAIMPDGFVGLTRLRERDRHVLEDTWIARVVTQGESVGCQCGVEVALALESECLVEIIKPLGLEIMPVISEKPLPEAHPQKL